MLTKPAIQPLIRIVFFHHSCLNPAQSIIPRINQSPAISPATDKMTEAIT